MKYAVKANNQFNGVVYDSLNDAITAHHAKYNESLIPVKSLTNMGSEFAPNWQAELPTLEEHRAQTVCTMRQARLALHQVGLLSQIDSTIAAMDEPDRTTAQIEWEYATEVKRDWPWVISLGTALGLTESQIDDLFALASTL
jgi:hypothetical protein